MIVYIRNKLLRMQNAKCKMQNDCIRFADDFLMIAAGDTTIMHYAL